MPPALQEQIATLEKWALANERDARRDAVGFWMFKIPAMAASTGAGVFAYLGWEVIPLIIGAAASSCILIDALNPRGKLRNAHVLAVHDLRNLQQEMATRWRVGELRLAESSDKAKEENLLAARIIEEAQGEKKRIEAYLKQAETLLGVKQSE